MGYLVEASDESSNRTVYDELNQVTDACNLILLATTEKFKHLAKLELNVHSFKHAEVEIGKHARSSDRTNWPLSELMVQLPNLARMVDCLSWLKAEGRGDWLVIESHPTQSYSKEYGVDLIVRNPANTEVLFFEITDAK